MKKFVLFVAMIASSFCAKAFEFDGINLNSPFSNVTKEIAKRGYVHDAERNCLTGDCQGRKIYLSFDAVNVNQRGMVGKVIVDMPVEGDAVAVMANYAGILDVLYHQVKSEDASTTYLVDKDGTTLGISNSEAGYVKLTFTTPFYSKDKKSKK